MPDPRQFDPDRMRVALDHGEVVELDGGTLVLDGEQSPSLLLRLTPWCARSVARVLQEWTSVSRIFHHSTRPHLDELALSQTLELAAALLDGGEEPIVPCSRGSRVIPNRQRLAAVAVLGEREGTSVRSAAAGLGGCCCVVAFGTERRRGVRLRTACCKLCSGDDCGTCLPRPDHSSRQKRQWQRAHFLVAAGPRPLVSVLRQVIAEQDVK
jgi:hypothetical protein